MMFQYYMSRYGSAVIYTFEFLFSVGLIAILVVLYWKKLDRNSLPVFLISSMFHTILELGAQGLGIRVVTGAMIFSIEIGYPFICIIIGFFEGGLVGFSAYHFVQWIDKNETYSRNIFLGVSLFLIGFFTIHNLLSQLYFADATSVASITRREIFSPLSILFLIILFLIPILYIFLYKGVLPEERKLLLSFYLGLSLFTLVIIIPNHLSGLRFIEIRTGDTYKKAPLLDQILIMYGYNGLFESGGFLIQHFIVLHYFGFLRYQKK
ncbi:MAG: hypothetical protein ACTSQJ_14565 [Promethearchaeota archaeon]